MTSVRPSVRKRLTWQSLIRLSSGGGNSRIPESTFSRSQLRHDVSRTKRTIFKSNYQSLKTMCGQKKKSNPKSGRGHFRIQRGSSEQSEASEWLQDPAAGSATQRCVSVCSTHDSAPLSIRARPWSHTLQHLAPPTTQGQSTPGAKIRLIPVAEFWWWRSIKWCCRLFWSIKMLLLVNILLIFNPAFQNLCKTIKSTS